MGDREKIADGAATGDTSPRPAVADPQKQPTVENVSLATSGLIDRLPTFLKAGALLIRDTCGCGDAHAALIALAAQGAAIGPSNKIVCSLGGGSHFPTTDPLLVDDASGHLMSSAKELLGPLMAFPTKAADFYGDMTEMELRAKRLMALQRSGELEGEVRRLQDRASRLARYRETDAGETVDSAFDLMANEAGDARRLQALDGELTAARITAGEALFARRPVILTGGPTARMLRDWAELTFDRCVLDTLNSGAEILALLSRNAGTLLAFLGGCGSGTPSFAVGDVQYAGAGITLIWACRQEELPAILDHPALMHPALAGRLLAVPGGSEPPRNAEPARRAHWLEIWSSHAIDLIMSRISGTRNVHCLSPEAAASHRDFAARCEAAARSASDPRAEAHLAALPRIALRLALGLRIGAGAEGLAAGEIPAADHRLAIDIAERVSAAHMCALTACPLRPVATGLDAEVEILMAKLRIRGACTRRELVRAYHRGNYRKLQPVVEAAMRDGLITVEGDKLIAAGDGERRRVGASAGDM